MNDDLKYSLSGQAMTKSFEGLRLAAYLDKAGIWTIGYGHTGKMVHPGMTITQYDADQWFALDISGACKAVKGLVNVPLNQNQYDALVDFTFNLGAGNLATSTLLKRVNDGNLIEAGHEFLRWVYAGAQISTQLQKRREAERKLYLAPIAETVEAK